MRIKIACWNVGGASFLKKPELQKSPGAHSELLARLCQDHDPDFVLLQEVVGYPDRGTGRTQNLVGPLVDDSGKPWNHYRQSDIIDTAQHSHPNKWGQVRTKGEWSPADRLVQGNALLWRHDIAHTSIWEDSARPGDTLQIEEVRLETGLFMGTRTTEPRVASVAHFVHEDRHVFVVNVHLTTLVGEREDLAETDKRGSQIRLAQIRVILDGVVSRYNSWRRERNGGKGPIPLWIIGGDFNATENSEEIAEMGRARFVDVCPRKGFGTKRRRGGKQAELTVDYIFVGLRYYSCWRDGRDPKIVNPSEPLYWPSNPSDHYPIVAEVEV